MRILDTNIWVYAFTGENQRAVELVEEVLRGETETVIDTYLYLEVICAFENSNRLDRKATQVAQDQFGQIVWGRRFESVHAEIDEHLPSTDATLSAEIEQFRTDSYNRLVAQILRVQPKDASIVHLAFALDRDASVYTNDSEFASLEPADHRLSRISMVYVQSRSDGKRSEISGAYFE